MVTLRSAADRGQLLLVTALALAVLLVTVALLLNTAIFTENVATRDTTADGHEAIELRGELVAAIGDLIETENYRRSGSTATVETGVDTMGTEQTLVERERGRYGTVATLARNDSATPGQLLRWNDTDTNRQFDVDGGNWTLVEDLDAARNVTLTVDPASLVETTASESADDTAFGVRFNRSGETVTQYIYKQSGSGDLAIAESVDGSPPERQCQIDLTNLNSEDRNTTVDLTGDRLSTDASAVDCFRGLWPADDPDAIEFVNGNTAEGRFAATVDETATPIVNDEVEKTSAVYSVTVDIAYTTAELDFETTVRVAPGEPR